MGRRHSFGVIVDCNCNCLLLLMLIEMGMLMEMLREMLREILILMEDLISMEQINNMTRF